MRSLAGSGYTLANLVLGGPWCCHCGPRTMTDDGPRTSPDSTKHQAPRTVLRRLCLEPSQQRPSTGRARPWNRSQYHDQRQRIGRSAPTCGAAPPQTLSSCVRARYARRTAMIMPGRCSTAKNRNGGFRIAAPKSPNASWVNGLRKIYSTRPSSVCRSRLPGEPGADRLVGLQPVASSAHAANRARDGDERQDEDDPAQE